MDEAVIKAIEDKLLTPDALNTILHRAALAIEARVKEKPERIKELKAEIRKIRLEVDRYVAAIGDGKAPSSVIEQITQRESRLQTLERDLARYENPVQLDELRIRRIKKIAAERLLMFRDLMRSNVPRARQVLRKVLRNENVVLEKIVIEPVKEEGGQGYQFRGKLWLAGVLDNIGAEERT